MHPYRNHAKAAITVILFAAFQNITVGQNHFKKEQPVKQIRSVSTNPELVQTLRAAYTDWISRAKVKGHYSLITGMISQQSDQFKIDKLENPDKYNGFFAVDGTQWRLSYISDHDPVAKGQSVAPKGGTNVRLYSHISTDEVFDGRIFLSYKPSQGIIKSTAQIMDMLAVEPDQDGIRRAPGMLSAILNPISPMRVHPGGMPGELYPLPEADKYNVLFIDKNIVRLNVVSSIKGPTASTSAEVNYTIEWDVSAIHPIVKRIIWEYKNATGKTSRDEFVIKDFCVINEFLIGRYVTHIESGKITNAQGEVLDKRRVTHWTSEDLCKIIPTAEDFTIEVPAGTSVAGLKSVSYTKQPFRISIHDIKSEELMKPGDSVSSSSELHEDKPRNATSYTLLWLNTVIIVFIGIYLFYRHKKKQ